MFDSLFSERGLSLDRLKVLIEVRDAGSIAQAAPGDPVRQSQFSRQLRELSEFFGCEVARRRGKILKLTAPGERPAELAREHLRLLDDFRSACRVESVAFTIGAGDSLIQWLVIPRIGRVMQSFPGTRFATSNLRTNEIVQQLTDGRIDFGLIRRDAVPRGVVHELHPIRQLKRNASSPSRIRSIRGAVDVLSWSTASDGGGSGEFITSPLRR